MERKEEGLSLVKCPPYFTWDECFINCIPLIPINPYKVSINFSYFIEKEYVRETGQVTKLVTVCGSVHFCVWYEETNYGERGRKLQTILV